jgi:hypothetical protein
MTLAAITNIIMTLIMKRRNIIQLCAAADGDDEEVRGNMENGV